MSTNDAAIDLAQFDLPVAGINRIANSKHGAAGAVTSSNFDLDEFLALRSAGVDSVGVVVGSSVYELSPQDSTGSDVGDTKALTQAVYHARTLAMMRLRAEAVGLGCHGVLGVRSSVRTLHRYVVEFTSVGTAVAIPSGDQARSGLFTSHLSGSEFLQLRAAGYEAVNCVQGSAVCFDKLNSAADVPDSLDKNAELRLWTNSLASGRESASTG